MSLSEAESQTLLMFVEGILADYDEDISAADLLNIANKLDTKYPDLNFILSCKEEALSISYFDCEGVGSRHRFELRHHVPVNALNIN